LFSESCGRAFLDFLPSEKILASGMQYASSAEAEKTFIVVPGLWRKRSCKAKGNLDGDQESSFASAQIAF
jgi:hypothetical protein